MVKRKLPESFEWVLVTPDIARTMLEKKNPTYTNRPISIAHVAKLARTMKTGHWIRNTNPVKFDYENQLFDGQHRLRALIESGLTLELLIARNCDPDEFEVQDTGLKRSLADVEFIRQGGKTHMKYIKTSIAISNHMLHGLSTWRGTLTDADRMDFYHAHADSIQWVMSVAGTREKGVAHSTVVQAVVARAYYSHDISVLARFLQQFQYGNVESANSPVRLLRDYCLENILQGHKRRNEIYRMTESALKAFLEKREVKTLKLTERELFPLPEESEPRVA